MLEIYGGAGDLFTKCILFSETYAIACIRAGTHTSKFTCPIYHMRKIIVFSFLFCYYYIFLIRRNFSLKDFLLNVIYMKFKM